MPEFPEIEALRRQIDDPIRAFPVAKAGPAHIATLKTYEPPLSALEGRRFGGAERRGEKILLSPDDRGLGLPAHLMSPGPRRHPRHGDNQPKTPAFTPSLGGGGPLVLTEPGGD